MQFKLSGWSVKARLIFLCLLFAVPLTGVILYQVLSGINATIDTAKAEIVGNAYQRPLEDLLEKIPQYGWAAAAGKPEASSIRGEVDQAFDRLAAVQKESGDDLQVTEKGLAARKLEAVAPVRLRERWAATASLSGETLLDATDGLASDVQALITHIGNTSGLILDPDLDSYYLVDFTLVRMPQTQGRIGQLFRTGRSAIASGISTEAVRQQFAITGAMLRDDDLGAALSDVKTSFDEDPNFYGVSPTLQPSLAPAVKAYQEKTEALIAEVGKLASGGAATADEFQSTALSARAQSFAVWQTAVKELDTLLELRIQYYQTRRWICLSLTFTAVGVAGWVAVTVIRGLNRELEESVGALSETLQETTEQSRRLREGSQHLADAASRQAAAIEETSASLEEMNSMTKQTNDHAESGRTLANAARAAAEGGTSRMRDLGDSIRRVGTLRKQMEATMDEIKTSNSAISKIIKTIDEIAFQTNILALNAAVEAARAGEAGAGFAVVADEVRNLAQRAAQAAKETGELIESTIGRSDQGVTVGHEVGKMLEVVEDLAHKVDAQLSEISGKVTQVDQVMGEIAGASGQQAEGIRQVTGAISDLDQTTQANAGEAEETAQAAAQLTEQTEDLDGVVRALKKLLGEEGLGGAPVPAPRAARVVTASTLSHAKPRTATAKPGTLGLGAPKAKPSTPFPMEE